jgi:nucleoside-diphosphate-sugar epimerase
MKKALVTGAGGFIAHHLIRRLKQEGYWVRGVDIKHPEFSESSADEFKILDLRELENCKKAFTRTDPFDEAYHLAADMGGMGFIHSAACEIMRNSALININMTNAAAQCKIPRYFFSSLVSAVAPGLVSGGVAVATAAVPVHSRIANSAASPRRVPARMIRV